MNRAPTIATILWSTAYNLHTYEPYRSDRISSKCCNMNTTRWCNVPSRLILFRGTRHIKIVRYLTIDIYLHLSTSTYHNSIADRKTAADKCEFCTIVI